MSGKACRKPPLYILVLAAILVVFVCFEPRMPVSVAYDPNDENCLPEFSYALLVHFPPKHVAQGDLVFWAPQGALSYVKQQYVLKRVAGIPGDHLVVKDGAVFINDKAVATAMPLAHLYNKKTKDFDRDVLIPENAYYLTGTHPLADDSRYWGFLYKNQIAGKAYEIF